MTTPTDDLTQRARDRIEGLELDAAHYRSRGLPAHAEWAQESADLLRVLIEERERLREMGERVSSLDRQPHPPSGGMQTGDMIVVGMRDWFRLLRLARMCSALTPKEPTDGE